MTIKQKWTADIKDWQKKTEKQREEIEKLKTKIAELAAGSKKAAGEQTRMGRQAAKALKDAQTPAERYKARLGEIEKMAKAAGWTEKQTAQVRRKAYQDYQAAIQRTKTAHQGMGGVIGQNVAALKGMVMGLIGVQGVRRAIQLVRQAYQEWQQDIRQLAQESSKLHGDLIRDLTEAGDLAIGAQITGAIEGLPAATREQGRRVYAGIRGEAQFLGPADLTALIRATSRAAPLGVDMQQLGAMAGQMKELMPGETAADIADMALAIQQLAGKELPTLTSRSTRQLLSAAEKAGLGMEEAYGIVLGALEKGLRATTVVTLFEKATEPSETFLAKAEQEAERQRKARAAGKAVTGPPPEALETFAAADIRQRITMLLRDPALNKAILGSEGFRQMFTPAEIARGAQAIERMRGVDYVQEQVALGRRVPVGAELQRAHELAVLDDQRRRTEEAIGRRREREVDALTAQLRDQDPISKLFARGALGMAQFFEAMPGFRERRLSAWNMLPGVSAGFSAFAMPFTRTGVIDREFIERERRAEEATRRQEELNRQQVEEIRGLRQDVQAQTAALNQQAIPPTPAREILETSPEPATSW